MTDNLTLSDKVGSIGELAFALSRILGIVSLGMDGGLPTEIELFEDGLHVLHAVLYVPDPRELFRRLEIEERSLPKMQMRVLEEYGKDVGIWVRFA